MTQEEAKRVCDAVKNRYADRHIMLTADVLEKSPDGTAIWGPNAIAYGPNMASEYRSILTEVAKDVLGRDIEPHEIGIRKIALPQQLAGGMGR